MNVECPVCQKNITIEEELIDKKLQCGLCGSKSRVRRQGGTIILKVLEEVLDWRDKLSLDDDVDEVAESEAVHSPQAQDTGPRLKTRLDKFREAAAEASASGRRPVTRGKSRRARF